MAGKLTQPPAPARLRQLQQDAQPGPASPLTYPLAAGTPAAAGRAAWGTPHEAEAAAESRLPGDGRHRLEPARPASPPQQPGNEPRLSTPQPRAWLRLPSAPRQPPAVPEQPAVFRAPAPVAAPGRMQPAEPAARHAEGIQPQPRRRSPAPGASAGRPQQPVKPVLKRLRRCAQWAMGCLGLYGRPPTSLQLQAPCTGPVLALSQQLPAQRVQSPSACQAHELS